MKHSCAVFVANRGFHLTSSRLPLMRPLIRAGWRVVAATADDEYARQLAKEGVIIESVHFYRGGFSARSDLGTLLALVRIYRKYSPDLVHHFTAKPVILGTFAARLARGDKVRIVNNITGLGHAFIKGGVSKRLAIAGYQLSLRRANINIFENRDDQRLFEEHSWTTPDRSRLIVSAGVDISRFRPPTMQVNDPATVLMVGRLLWQKGVGEFLKAAKTVKKKFPSVRFQLAGEFDPIHPDAVPEKAIELAVAAGTIEFLGYLNNMEEVLPSITVFVLPSYREGVPRVVLEAAACAIPTIGADVPGTREAVIHGETGFLVPVRDSDALATRICEVLENETLRRRFGEAAVRMAREKFSIKIITEKHIAVYREIGIHV